MKSTAQSSLLIAMSLFVASTRADQFDPPANYYDSATSVGPALQNQLHDIIDGHTVLSYNSARANLQVTDVDPNDSDNIILVYNRVSLDVSGLISSPGIPGWDSGVSWNREHTWPRSRGVNSSGPDNSDLHQLRPATPSVNNSRGNLNFGGAFGQPFGSTNDGGSTVWYPGDADAGMIARQQFYMDVRYDGSDSSTEDLVLLPGNPGSSGPNLGDLNRLIEWHYEAPPDDFELRRNDVIFDNYQGNRNPFIDRPEFVWSVFVDQNNDSQIAIDGATIGADGSTVSTVDLGRVLVGAAVPASQSVTLNKLGNDGTYYEVTANGDATSSLSGRYNAFTTRGADSVSFGVGLNTSTGTAGQRSGTVAIDNLDITTSGGTGRGANDGNDVVTVTLDVLDHAEPSFDVASDVDVLTLDFGSVPVGDAAPTLEFDIFNLESTAAFTAGLDLDAVVGSGDASVLTTDLAAFAGLEAGLGDSFKAKIDTTTAGVFSATYSLSFSDEDIAGGIGLGDLTLTLNAEVVAVAEDADFNQDLDVDGADYLTWQRGFGSGTTLAEGDANGSGNVDGADLAVWESQYASLAAPTVVATPEPSSCALLYSAMLCWRQRRVACKVKSFSTA